MKRSKYWDMSYYWLQDLMTQEQFEIYWQIGVDNEAEYSSIPQKHANQIYQRQNTTLRTEYHFTIETN